MQRDKVNMKLPGVFIHEKAMVESDAVGSGTRVWAFAHIMEGAAVGRDCNICDHCFIESGARLGNNVTVKNGVAIWDGVTIEDDVFIGPYAVLTNDLNPRAAIKKGPEDLLPTQIRKGATVGANATILCGITLGRYVFIGAGAVVTQDVGDYEMGVGNPFRRTGWMCSCGVRIAFRLPENADETAHCPDCQKVYIRQQGRVRESESR